MSLENPDRAMNCPICLDTMKIPILQCARGHSMCGECIKSTEITMCPCCRGSLTTIRNFQLEQLIDSLKSIKISCVYARKGCKYILSKDEKDDHEFECKFRKFQCEGKKFANWKCEWSGDLTDMHKHFKDYHNNHTWMEYRTDATMKMCLESEFLDVQIISFFNGQNYFYYKHKVDIAKQKAFWTFQLVGLKNHARNYYYEFEVHNGPIRKFKVTEICENDTVDANKIFEKETCAVMSFGTIRSFLNAQGELPFKFRIMSIKKTAK